MSSRTRENEHSFGQALFGIGLLFFAVLLLMSLVSYDPFDLARFKSPPNEPARNFVGAFGAWLGYVSFWNFGLGAYTLAMIVLALGILCQQRARRDVIGKALWMVLALIAFCCQLQLMETLFSPVTSANNLLGPGGVLGYVMGKSLLLRGMGNVGSGILLAFALFVAMIMIFELHPARLFSRAWEWILVTWHNTMARLAARKTSKEDLEELLTAARPRRPSPPARKPKPSEKTPLPTSILPEPEGDEDDEEDVSPAPEMFTPSVPKEVVPEPKPSRGRKPAEPPADSLELDQILGNTSASSLPNPHASTHWKLPPISLLNESPIEGRVAQGHSEETRHILEKTLSEFGIDARITNVETGPTVTSFEVLPAPGVRVEKISSLSKNLALALKAESIRVQAPIPGKGVVGIELPNPKGAKVFIRDLLETADWRKSKAALPLVVGIDVSGRNIVADLAEMPHLLIAGATGSGKSVCMNSLLAGLLMSRTPDQLRLILVDPKIVEFTAYNELPHLVVPVITDAKKVGLGLRWAINEMEKRYKLFARVGVRNIKAFNSRKLVEQGELFDLTSPDATPAPDQPPASLPYIVVVIDELADLMMVAQAEIENSIARLAQLSRAVGIHMILATQRPSVNVITGTIKANFPARIAFQVAQKVDSRTILDANGADALLGKGDMLFLPPGVARLLRAQGAMTTDEEINRIVAFIKEQGTPEYEAIIKEKIESKIPEMPENEDEDNELIEAAIAVIRQSRRASTSSLQRRLRIGYNRAARLMDQLEERGVVGPPQGSDPREILIDLDGEIPNNEASAEPGVEEE